MEDVFELMEREHERIKQEQKMIEALKQNHYSENVILVSPRDQMILHQILVEGKTINEIASELELSPERVRQLKSRASTRLLSYLSREESALAESTAFDYEPVVPKELGYDVYEVMAQPDERRLEEVTQLLNADLDNREFSVRAYNCLRAARIETLGDLFKLESITDLLKHRNFGKKSLVEIEVLLIEKGLKFRNQPASEYPYYLPKQEIKLPLTYPVLNFAWSDEIQQAFKQHNIFTIQSLLRARQLLFANQNLLPEHFEFIEHRLKEWGLKWK